MSVKKTKGLRVHKDYDGRVNIESQNKQVILSNKLSQAELTELFKNPIAAGFMEKATITTDPNEGQKEIGHSPE